MKKFARRMSLGLTFLALTLAFSGTAYAGCGESCYDITCIEDDPSIGCVERWGYCWEVPCFAAADSESCRVDKALEEAFASFDDVTGAEALELLRNNETYAAEILPFVRVVGENGEVFRGAEYQRPDSKTKLAEKADKAKAERKAER